jgi:hypothetical protein
MLRQALYLKFKEKGPMGQPRNKMVQSGTGRHQKER